MFTKYFLNLAAKGNHNYSDKDVRERIGYTAGLVGVFVNLLLSILKLAVGLTTSSIAVTADAFNNLSDTASSIMTVIGFKLSNVPPDKEHPYGHGRIEYLTALMIAFMVILVGFKFVKSSVDRIINPKVIVFQVIPFILLVISISLKIWLSIFNRKLGNKISSAALQATATDALGDVIITSVVAFSLLLSLFTNYPIDGYIGILVSTFILYSGFSLVKETVSHLIGKAPDKDLIDELMDEILSYDYILGAHDLIVHNYGPGKVMATIDVEIPFDIDVVTIHDIIDQAERELSERFNLHLVIHMDPVGFQSKETVEIMNKIKNRIKKDEFIKSMHDFNIIEQNDNKVVVFHVVVDGSKIDRQFSGEKYKEELAEIIKGINSALDCDIIVDTEY